MGHTNEQRGTRRYDDVDPNPLHCRGHVSWGSSHASWGAGVSMIGQDRGYGHASR